MDAQSEVLAQVCDLLTKRDHEGARAVIAANYPHVPLENQGRRYTPREMTAVFVRDGFIDRYTGVRLIFPPVLRVISAELPIEFPAHKNWKMSETHAAFWDLFPTIDHIVPVARGGVDDESNWVTTSMASNAAKANWTLEQLGWNLAPPGDLESWDGMSSWLLDYLDEHDHHATRYVRK
jgi:hypothetical protein